MSLILEALKKAERQHKLGEVPGIRPGAVESRTGGARLWLWFMLLLFAAVMLSLGLYLGGYWQNRGEPQAGVRLPEVNQPVTQPSLEATQAPTVDPIEPMIQATPAVSEKREPVIPPPSKAKPKPAKPLSEMSSGFVANLPALNIDIHSYDARPSKRYVLINLEKYREGDYLTEGPLLVEILTDGVILEHLGQRFILPIGNQ
jgi:general secretion pathway protein B